MKRPSPPVCATCVRPHVRIPAAVRAVRRKAVMEYVALVGADVGAYALGLFDHLTLGTKVGGPVARSWADRQAHPFPAFPEGLTAFQLYYIDRMVVLAAFGQF